MASGTINSLTIGKLMYKQIPLTAEMIGTSFSPASRNVGNAYNLFGIHANCVVAVWVHNLSLLPNATLCWGTFNLNLYVAATLSCTATFGSYPQITIVYKV